MTPEKLELLKPRITVEAQRSAAEVVSLLTNPDNVLNFYLSGNPKDRGAFKRVELADLRPMLLPIAGMPEKFVLRISLEEGSLVPAIELQAQFSPNPQIMTINCWLDRRQEHIARDLRAKFGDFYDRIEVVSIRDFDMDVSLMNYISLSDPTTATSELYARYDQGSLIGLRNGIVDQLRND